MKKNNISHYLAKYPFVVALILIGFNFAVIRKIPDSGKWLVILLFFGLFLTYVVYQKSRKRSNKPLEESSYYQDLKKKIEESNHPLYKLSDSEINRMQKINLFIFLIMIVVAFVAKPLGFYTPMFGVSIFGIFILSVVIQSIYLIYRSGKKSIASGLFGALILSSGLIFIPDSVLPQEIPTQFISASLLIMAMVIIWSMLHGLYLSTHYVMPLANYRFINKKVKQSRSSK